MYYWNLFISRNNMEEFYEASRIIQKHIIYNANTNVKIKSIIV